MKYFDFPSLLPPREELTDQAGQNYDVQVEEMSELRGAGGTHPPRKNLSDDHYGREKRAISVLDFVGRFIARHLARRSYIPDTGATLFTA